MKILIDIAHPAHLHYFRNFAGIFENKGHEVLFTLRDKGIITDLAKSYGLDSIVRSKNEKCKIIYAVKSILNIYRIARVYKPDIFLDMGTIFAAPVSWLLCKPHIVFDDTESAYKARWIFMPFISTILTPDIFLINLGKKHVRFNSFMEMLYLHKHYYSKAGNIKTKLGLLAEEAYVVLRFVSWEAHHDKGLTGLPLEIKLQVVNEFSKYARVFISSESELPDVLRPYKLDIEPALIHDVLAEARLYFGEGATMAMESVILGTPAIYINPNWPGYTIEAEKRGLLFNFRLDHPSQERAIYTGLEILQNPKSKVEVLSLGEKYIKTKIDPTGFLVWFVEEWPESFRIMRENPEYQKKFL